MNGISAMQMAQQVVRKLVLVASTVLICAGCTKEDADKPAVLVDEKAQPYRFFFDGPSSAKDFQVRRFDGQIRMADVDGIFGDRRQLPRDFDGNAVGTLRAVDGLMWSAVFDPSLESVNVATISPEGSFSSAFDFDGDMVADVLDVRLPDDRRYSFANELGLEFLGRWLEGHDPLCDEELFSRLAIPGFNCDRAQGSGGSSERGGSTFVDPLESICAEFQDGSTRPPVMTHRAQGYGSRVGVHGTQYWDSSGPLRAFLGVVTYYDDAGNHVSTTRETRYFDAEHGNYLVRTVRERVDSEGNGTRTITDYDDDGTPTSRTETFETEVDSEGRYPSKDPLDDPNAPDKHRELDSTDPRPWPRDLSPNSTDDSGPVDTGLTDDGWEVWCEATAPGGFVSGAEVAAGTDLSVFRDPICFNTDPNANLGNCVDIERARPEDFRSILDTADATGGCGDFEQPGPDGTCGPRTGLEELKGRTASLVSADLERVQICNPIVCSPR